MQLELLSPAGDFERLEAAILYGADAVYLGSTQFGMRATPQNFSGEQLANAVAFAHQKGVKVYLTCNTLPRNEEIPHLPAFIKQASEAKIDACIVNDIGVLMMVKQLAPKMELHVSTQAGVMNYQTAQAFYNLGAKRVVLARELSLEEIACIRANIPPDMEIETFVHGAMCMSVSGRCLISDYMVGREANRGACAQPCRWKYHLVEESRPGVYHEIGENEQGSYLLNANDLCMITQIDKLAKAGVSSLKIEGRAKSAYYTAVVTNAYRMAIKSFLNDPNDFSLPDWVASEVDKVSHRPYSSGFYFSQPTQNQASGGYLRQYDVVAVVTGCENGRVYCTQKNKCYEGDEVEILPPSTPPIHCQLRSLQDGSGNPLESTPHAQMPFSFEQEGDFVAGTMIRKQDKHRS